MNKVVLFLGLCCINQLFGAARSAELAAKLDRSRAKEIADLEKMRMAIAESRTDKTDEPITEFLANSLAREYELEFAESEDLKALLTNDFLNKLAVDAVFKVNPETALPLQKAKAKGLLYQGKHTRIIGVKQEPINRWKVALGMV